MTNPIRPTDDEARALGRGLLDDATHAALAVMDTARGLPMVSRVALARGPDGAPVTLVSTLAAHTAPLAAHPGCSLLVGEPGDRGDPLTHPRMTLLCQARLIRPGDEGHAALRDDYVAKRPKSKLYVDFGDFLFVRFAVSQALLNGGFGKAFHLTAGDIGCPAD